MSATKLSWMNGLITAWDLTKWLSGKESTCQCRRRGFNIWVGKISWRKKWLPTPVGKSYGQRSLAQSWVRKESDTTDHMHVHARVHTHTHTYTQSKSSKMEFKRFLGKIPIFIFMKLRLKFAFPSIVNEGEMVMIVSVTVSPVKITNIFTSHSSCACAS